MKNTDFHICEFHRPQFQIATFSEIISVLISSLNKYSQPAYFVQNAYSNSGVNIIFGSHRIFQSNISFSKFPKNSVIFNLEPLVKDSKDKSHLLYIDLLKNSRVIDYSPKNIALLNSLGNTNIHQFKFGFSPFLSRNIGPPRHENYFFYGVMSDRRRAIIDQLTEKNAPIFGSTSCWAYERDYQILASKAVINISKFSNSVLEIYRLWHSLCLGTPVISEMGCDTELISEWSEYVTFIDDLKNFDFKNFNNLISPDVYRKHTSFDLELNKLVNWINQDS